MGKPAARFNIPRKGTNRRKMMLLMMRPEGLSSDYALRHNLIKSSSHFSHMIEDFYERCPFIIDIIGSVSTKTKPCKIYKITGRYKNVPPAGR